MLSALLLATVLDLSPELQTTAQETHLPAIQAAVAKSEGLHAHGAVGARVEDAFHIGSCAKPFAATLVALLVDEKKMTWETKVVDVFPEWKSGILEAYAATTIADLLSHESGVQAFTDDQELTKLPKFPGNTVERRRA
jgi:CubicO group peptidase (beta-lactamase class C family)